MQRGSLRDVSLPQVVCQHPAEVVQTGLAGTIGEGLERGDTEPVNAANVDDAGRVIRGRCLLQKRSHKLSEIEDPVEVEGEDSSESGGRILVVGSAPVRTGVVDQDVELCRVVVCVSISLVSSDHV